VKAADSFHATALEVLCRVFEDGADARHDKWLDWYDPTKWMHPSRALGAFISLELKPEREALVGTLAQLAEARRTGEYWKAEHNAANDALRAADAELANKREAVELLAGALQGAEAIAAAARAYVAAKEASDSAVQGDDLDALWDAKTAAYAALVSACEAKQ
jgi:hypothetical protein